MDWEERRVLVTGAGGFIGSHLVEELIRRGSSVTAFVHYNSRNDWGLIEGLFPGQDPSLKVVSGDVADAYAVRSAAKEQDVVFHLAALIGIPYSYVAPASYVSTNVNGTLNVMQAALDEGVERVVHTSTSETYGTAQYTPIDESHPLQGQSPYSATKIGADKIAESFFCSFGLPVSIIRPFNTYGPRQSARAVIPTIITQALTSDSVRLGSLNPVRDMNYVSDTVRGFIGMAEAPGAVGKTINVGSGRGVTIGEIARIILAQVNPGAEIITDEQRVRPGKSEVMELICDSSRAKEVLGWSPEVSLEGGLAETIAWMRGHLGDYKAGLYTI